MAALPNNEARRVPLGLLAKALREGGEREPVLEGDESMSVAAAAVGF